VKLLSIAILFVGCAARLPAASITGVVNSASAVPPNLPNSGIAQGSIFVVYGSGLGPSTLLEVSSYPLPTTQGLGGTTVTVTVGSVTETCIMFYTVSTQVAAILPSATPVGNGTLTVTYQGQSASIAIQVSAAGFGTYTLNQDGNGPAVVTDIYYHPINMVNPAYPGENLVLWGTGLGAVTGNETEPPVQVDLGTGVQVLIENQPATVLYGGRSGDAGLDQINFTVPMGISGGCKTSIAVFEKGVVSNMTTMAVAPQGQSTCGDTYGALTATNLQKAVATGTLNIATVALNRVGTGNDVMSASFLSYPLASLIASYGGSVGASIGSCNSYELLQGSSLVITDPIQPPTLNAGASLTVTGPAGTKTVTASSTGEYPATLGTSSDVYIEPGNYTVSNGSGGTQVSPFTWDLPTLPPPVAFTNLPSTINRAQNLTVTWSNGAAFPFVSIFAYSAVPVTSTQNSYAEFFCTAAGSAGQFTIPSAVLELLPANGYAAFGVPGVGMQIAGVAVSRSTASGSPGIDAGIFSALTSSGAIVQVQ
jgi:uncharacterized protein (TIGR03437 family)